jgi:hypothetical protein
MALPFLRQFTDGIGRNRNNGAYTGLQKATRVADLLRESENRQVGRANQLLDT